ncbi:MAG: hypothetical protein KAT23_03160, partial [Anaerolineales bacterium]|nr:hypothetical protein [Anaerolineales bacterium]
MALVILAAACAPHSPATTPMPTAVTPTPDNHPTPLPVRSPFSPGELVNYNTQSGDTLPALAAHFNTT